MPGPVPKALAPSGSLGQSFDMRRVLRLSLLLVVWSAPCTVLAQTPLRRSEEQLVNYAFATQLGSGIYDISGRTLQIYRLPFGYTFLQPDGAHPGVRLTLPLTIGFLDFKTLDVLHTGLPESLSTLSFVPGIELDFALSPRWHLLPFAQAGRSWDLDGAGDATVYSFGAHLAGSAHGGPFAFRLDVGTTYAAVEPNGPVRSDDLTLLELGLESRHALGLNLAGHPLDWGAYLLTQYFVNRPDEPVDNAPGSGDPFQFEVGLTIGPQSRMTVWHIPVPRIGIGYRFAQDLGVWRLVLGAPF